MFNAAKKINVLFAQILLVKIRIREEMAKKINTFPGLPYIFCSEKKPVKDLCKSG